MIYENAPADLSSSGNLYIYEIKAIDRKSPFYIVTTELEGNENALFDMQDKCTELFKDIFDAEGVKKGMTKKITIDPKEGSSEKLKNLMNCFTSQTPLGPIFK